MMKMNSVPNKLLNTHNKASSSSSPSPLLRFVTTPPLRVEVVTKRGEGLDEEDDKNKKLNIERIGKEKTKHKNKKSKKAGKATKGLKENKLYAEYFLKRWIYQMPAYFNF